MRRLYLCALTLLALLALASCGSQKSYTWQRIQSDVQVRASGTLAVTETLTLRYTGGPFTFAFRDLPDRRIDDITNISVTADGRSFQQVTDEESAQPFTFSVSREDDAQRIRWVYPETVGGTQTFTLRYDVAGAVRRYADADEIWWSFVFPNRDAPVEQAVGQMTLPAPVPAAQLDATTPDVAASVERGPGTASVEATNIAAGKELTLQLRFPKNIVGGAAPAWQAAADAQDRYNATTRPTVNVALSALAAGMLVLLAGLLFAWWRRNRDPQPTGIAFTEAVQPPDDLAPALAAKLTGNGDGQALLGTLLDLANRGYLTLHEDAQGQDAGTGRIMAARTDEPRADLAPYERQTLDALFGDAREVDVKKQRAALSKASSVAGKTSQTQLIARDLLSEIGLARRRRGLIIGAVLFGVGLVAFIPAALFAERYSVWLPVLAGVVALAGLGWLFVAALVRGVTEQGAQALARWKAFQTYLKRIKPEQAAHGQFSTLLPYAAALGDTSHLTITYSTVAEPLPIWYYPMLAQGGQHSASSAGVAGNGLMLHDFSQNFLASLTNVSGSTGASGTGSVGGAGGASGGGGGGAG